MLWTYVHYYKTFLISISPLKIIEMYIHICNWFCNMMTVGQVSWWCCITSYYWCAVQIVIRSNGCCPCKQGIFFIVLSYLRWLSSIVFYGCNFIVEYLSFMQKWNHDLHVYVCACACFCTLCYRNLRCLLFPSFWRLV